MSWSCTVSRARPATDWREQNRDDSTLAENDCVAATPFFPFAWYAMAMTNAQNLEPELGCDVEANVSAQAPLPMPATSFGGEKGELCE